MKIRTQLHKYSTSKKKYYKREQGEQDSCDLSKQTKLESIRKGKKLMARAKEKIISINMEDNKGEGEKLHTR